MEGHLLRTAVCQALGWAQELNCSLTGPLPLSTPVQIRHWPGRELKRKQIPGDREDPRKGKKESSSSFGFTLLFSKNKNCHRSWGDSTIGRKFALHVADSSLIPGIPYGP